MITLTGPKSLIKIVFINIEILKMASIMQRKSNHWNTAESVSLVVMESAGIHRWTNSILDVKSQIAIVMHMIVLNDVS